MLLTQIKPGVPVDLRPESVHLRVSFRVRIPEHLGLHNLLAFSLRVFRHDGMTPALDSLRGPNESRYGSWRDRPGDRHLQYGRIDQTHGSLPSVSRT